MFGLERKKGSAELIEGALSMFTTALSDLEAGIQEGTAEITLKKEDLEEKRTEFLNAEIRVNTKIEVINADITKATKISSNIQALLN